MESTIDIGEMLAFGALLLAAVALAFALYAAIKESSRGVQKRLDALEHRMETEVSGLRLSLVIEEMCGTYLRESKSDRASDLQVIRVLLFRLIYASKRGDMLSALISMNGFANPYYKEFYSELRSFYLTIWASKRWHIAQLENDFRREYLETFDEDIDTAVSNSYLWEFLRQPTGWTDGNKINSHNANGDRSDVN